MKCPVCKANTTFMEAELDAGLIGRRCEQCGGNWLAGSLYWRWLDQRDPTMLRQELPEQHGAPLEVHDSGPAKLCPECGRFLTRVKIGHGLPFHIDRCANCSGLWFDANEWQVLKSRSLHDEVHFIFSSAWQADVARKERQQLHERTLTEKLGEADLAEIKRIKQWIDQHPRRSELYAYLLDQPERDRAGTVKQ